MLLGHVLGPCAGWRTYLDARFWDSRLTGQFLLAAIPGKRSLVKACTRILV